MTEQNGLGRSSATEASRTGLDAATLAKSLRRIAGDGGMEWVMEPMQARVLLDVADMLDERDRLRELVRDMLEYPWELLYGLTVTTESGKEIKPRERYVNRARELGIEVDA